jgi:hypothetical protein
MACRVHWPKGFLSHIMRWIVCFAVAAPAVFAASPASMLSRVPLRFEQAAPGAYLARGFGFGVEMRGAQAAMLLGQERLRLEFAGGNAEAPLCGEAKSATPNHEFRGREVRTSDAYLRVRAAEVYPGIDVVYYGAGQSLEYDFELAPGADIHQVRMRFGGANRVRLTETGDLELTLAHGVVTQKAPVTFQRLDSGEVVSVASHYVPTADGGYGLELGSFDARRALVVDPQLLFTAYLAGGGAENPLSISQDRNGSIYVAGNTSSRDFPLVGQAYSGFMLSPNPHVFVSKLNPLSTGDDVITYSGFFGGDFGDTLRDAVVNPDGVIFLTGITDDFFFPTTPNAYARSNQETRKMFVAAIDTRLPGKDGLIYSTFFGGKGPNEEPTAIALGPQPGQVYITGFTQGSDLPVKNPYQEKHFNAAIENRPDPDGFVAAFDITKSGADSLLASTYFGARSFDVPRSIAVDADGKAYIAGYTYSWELPVTGDAFQRTYAGGGDGFVAKLDLLGGRLEYASFLGGSTIDQTWRVVLDGPNRVALGGFTLSANYPVTTNALQPVQNGLGDATLTILELNKGREGLMYSTYFGGSDGDFVYALRKGPAGYYLGGYTLSRDLRTVDALRPASAGGGTDGFVAILNPAEAPANQLVYSSYVTGPGYQTVNALTVDALGNVYVTGQVYGNVFDPGQAAPPENSASDVFLFVFRPSAPPPARVGAMPSPAIGKRTRR